MDKENKEEFIYYNDEWNYCKSRQKNSNPELQYLIYEEQKLIKTLMNPKEWLFLK